MIHLENVCFSYSKEKLILDNLTVNIKNGTYLSVIGENGSGKSTLIKLILGFYKPNSGKISVSAKRIGYVSQKIGNFNNKFPITVGELLNCHLKAIKYKDKKEIENSLNMVGMENFETELVGNLSGGQIQRVFIAKSLMGNPELLIFDEIFTGVDEKTQKEILEILNNINKKGITIISVDHNLHTVYKNSTHVLKLTNGTGLFYSMDFFKNKEEFYAAL